MQNSTILSIYRSRQASGWCEAFKKSLTSIGKKIIANSWQSQAKCQTPGRALAPAVEPKYNNMFTKYCSSITLIIFSLLIFQSCIAKESEERHTYIIDNQSSFELRYKVEIDSELTDINIAIGSDDEIYSEVVLAGGLGTPNQHFNITAGYINSDIFLTRDSLGIEIEALKLNSDLDLNWIPKNSDSEVTFTLTVTDDMLQ